jgi:hypothetical protein
MTNTDEDDDDDTNAKTEHQLLSPLRPLFERFSAGFPRARVFKDNSAHTRLSFHEYGKKKEHYLETEAIAYKCRIGY